jgi:hypothetical protein
MKKDEKRTLMEEQQKQNSFVEYLKTSRHYFKGFESRLSQIKDPRNINYTDYPIEEIVYPVILKNVFNLHSMRESEETFIPQVAVDNLRTILGTHEAKRRIDRGYAPNYVTINECMERINSEELDNVRNWMVKKLLRMRSFENARFLDKYWLVIVDATQIFSSDKEHCDKCLTRKHVNKETGEEHVTYYHTVLEAKLVLGDGFVISIASEFIENDSEDAERQKNMGTEEIKQDCELKAFKRLAKKIKMAYKRLPICILGDSLYANESVFKLCDDYRWKWLIRFKDGSIPSVAKEFQILKDREIKNRHEGIKWVNAISYGDRYINAMEYLDIENDKVLQFQWISNINITKGKCVKIRNAGRSRWKIENEGFNIQKNLRYKIKHMNSKNYNAMKNHYLLVQIGDILLQLYEKSNKFIKVLKIRIKNISSDLLASFGRQLTREDISYTEKRTSLSIS